MGHEDMGRCASTADLDVHFFPRVSPSKEDLESGHADQFITTKKQDSTMSPAVFEPTVPLVERNVWRYEHQKSPASLQNQIGDVFRIPLTPSHRKRAMESPVFTKALETEVQDRRPWIHVPHVKNGRSQTYKSWVSEGQEFEPICCLCFLASKNQSVIAMILVKFVTH